MEFEYAELMSKIRYLATAINDGSLVSKGEKVRQENAKTI